MKNYKNSKRGFFFTVMALAILSFMLLTVQVWVRTFEEQDRHTAETFKGEAMRLVLATMSDKAFSEFANASAFYATYRLANATMLPTHALEYNAGTDPNNNGTGEVARVAYELMDNGTSVLAAGSPNINITYDNQTRGAYTYRAWQEKLQKAFNFMGMNATFSNMQDFNFTQLDPWTVGVHFKVEMNITSIDGTAHMSTTRIANTNFSIVGFEDPSIARNELLNHNPPLGDNMINDSIIAHKQIFMKPGYKNATSVKPTLLFGDGTWSSPSYGEGVGWFYGSIVYNYPTLNDMSQAEYDYYYSMNATIGLNQTVLVHGWDQNLSSYAQSFGAVIVTSPPNFTTVNMGGYNLTYQESCINCVCKCDPNCIGDLRCGNNQGGWQLQEPAFANMVQKPFIAINGTPSPLGQPVSYANYTNYDSSNPGFEFVLFDNQYDVPAPGAQTDWANKLPGSAYHRVWNIQNIRDMSMCGLYVEGPGPSFFQRMVNGSQALAGTSPYGIETILTGKWAGGANDTSNNKYSRLDWEFYGTTVSPHAISAMQVARVKGMSGCKDRTMCSSTSSTNNAVQNATGRFKMSVDTFNLDVLNGGMVSTGDAIDRYGLKDIICPEDAVGTMYAAPCGGNSNS